MKKMFTVGVLALASMSLASAKTYEITLAAPTKAGSVQLKPGQYTLKVDGSKAVFTFMETSKQFTTEVKVQTTEKKFEDTKVDANKDGGTDVIKDIELGGSKTRIEFTN
jgi:hypothetical protein